ncbi:SOS response-associated peptidase [Candidatus Colwellia aromaticivorans]|uniref:SOS response-associated peptidase n=1 Tax=Candidatus Colwellia aromaticivorans TaxID=2267621 RepID=UPI000DF2E9E5|nr:SOS response-associated peptidase family protein [Candidatus Colwellia aromaticivorans]
MCGRFSVVDKIAPIVSNLFNTPFKVMTNSNCSPSQFAATITTAQSGYQQINAAWGIKPNWSKKLIINAQSETVETKPTFKQAFQHQRCLVPCNGWYEWRTEEGKKVKYLFEHADQMPLYMPGILFKHEITELVTLTTTPNTKCGEYHKRMPVFILPEHTEHWFNSNSKQVAPLLEHVSDEMINICKAD